MRSLKFLFPLLFLIILFNSVTICQQRYFYTNKDYGSEALFNPLTLLLNGRYDITQLQSVSNKIENPYFNRMLKNVLGNLGDPFPRIRNMVPGNFLDRNYFPWESVLIICSGLQIISST
jgi:hypothetical protein